MRPPEPWTGSARKAATVSGPSSRMAFSRRFAAATPGLTEGSSETKRYGYGDLMWRKPGSLPPNIGQKMGRPVALIAAMVTPWYPKSRLMIFDFSGFPWVIQKNRAVLKAVSFDSPPPAVKKK